jgi:hypothetical protein
VFFKPVCKKGAVMQTERRFSTIVVALANVVLALFFLVSCEQSRPPAPPPRATTTDVFVVFEGPWAIVPDPKDSNSILAIAPKTKSHRSLALVPASIALETGVYELQVPAHGAPAGLNLDASFLRATVDPKNLQHALDSRRERYAIRLPKPEAYLAGSKYKSRVGSTYPPDASTEREYVTSISLRYGVTSKSGFSIAGTKDVGGLFNPLLLQLDTPIVRFVIDPVQDFGADPCDTHSRESFRDLVRLLAVTLYVDFPDNPSDCHKKDPQLVRAEKAQIHYLPAKQIAGAFNSDIPPQAAYFIGGNFVTYLDRGAKKIANSWAAAVYFFHSDSGGCKAPIIVATG